MQPRVLQKLLSFPDMLLDVKTIQRFLGFLNYIRQFYQHQAKDTKLIQQRLKVKSEWTEEMAIVVKRIKINIQNIPLRSSICIGNICF